MTNLITFKEFSKLLKANPNTVKSWKKRGDLPPNIFFQNWRNIVHISGQI